MNFWVSLDLYIILGFFIMRRRFDIEFYGLILLLHLGMASGFTVDSGGSPFRALRQYLAWAIVRALSISGLSPAT